MASLIQVLHELRTTNSNFIQAISMTHARDRKSQDNNVLPWHFGKLGIRNFSRAGSSGFFAEDFVLISSTADCALLPHFLDTFFYCSLGL